MYTTTPGFLLNFMSSCPNSCISEFKSNKILRFLFKIASYPKVGPLFVFIFSISVIFPLLTLYENHLPSVISLTLYIKSVILKFDIWNPNNSIIPDFIKFLKDKLLPEIYLSWMASNQIKYTKFILSSPFRLNLVERTVLEFIILIEG